jgi:hypothetical protein
MLSLGYCALQNFLNPISYADCSLSRLSSGRQVGCVVFEVVGCWAESLANQQRIARDSDQGLKSESRVKSAGWVELGSQRRQSSCGVNVKPWFR